MKNNLKTEKGFSLIDVTIAMLALALLAVAFLMAVNTALIASNQANVHVTAESLADGQMETIKAGGYSVAPRGGSGSYTSTISNLPSGYQFATLAADNSTVQNNIYGIPWDVSRDQPWTQATPADPGIQKVTILVMSRNEYGSNGNYKEIFRLIDFKVNR